MVKVTVTVNVRVSGRGRGSVSVRGRGSVRRRVALDLAVSYGLCTFGNTHNFSKTENPADAQVCDTPILQRSTSSCFVFVFRLRRLPSPLTEQPSLLPSSSGLDCRSRWRL